MDFYLSACQVITDYGESLANPAELSLSDLSDLSSHSPDAGKLELAAGEAVSGHVGYIIAEKRLVDLPSLFFTVDVTGNVTMDPEYADTSWVSIPTERS